jgi:hypothetical protein
VMRSPPQSGHVRAVKACPFVNPIRTSAAREPTAASPIQNDCRTMIPGSIHCADFGGPHPGLWNSKGAGAAGSGPAPDSA